MERKHLPAGPRRPGGRWPGPSPEARREAARGPADPLLVSVRSGGRESMPGMLDTILNLGLTEESVKGLVRSTNSELRLPGLLPPFHPDVRQRLQGHPGRALRGRDQEAEGEGRRQARPRARRPDDLGALTEEFRRIYKDETGEDFPEEPKRQLTEAIRAVFDSWMGDRARHYRHQPHPGRLGNRGQRPADGVRQRGDDSCSGVAFSRDEITGEPTPSGDFLPNAQGEDVVSGVRTPQDLHELEHSMPKAYRELIDILHSSRATTRTCRTRSSPWSRAPSTCSRRARPSGRRRRPSDSRSTRSRRPPDQGGGDRHDRPGALDALLHPTFAPNADYEILARGVAASPGAAKGEIVFDATHAVVRRKAATSCSSAPSRRPTTWPASTPPAASSSEGGKPATRRSWRGGWASPALPERRRST